MVSVLVEACKVYNHHGEVVGDSILVEDGLISRIGYGLHTGYAKHLSTDIVLPGFVDAHLHITGIGLSIRGVDLRGAKSINEILSRLSKSKDPIVYGRGWDQEELIEGRPPTRKELDRVSSDRPILAVRVCGHAGVANTVALNIARPWEVYPEYVDKETGLIIEDALYYMIKRLLSGVDSSVFIEESVRHIFDHGVVGVSSMSCEPFEARQLAMLDNRGLLPIRVSCYMDVDPADPRPSIPPGVLSPKVSVAGVKLYADGSLGARTAFLREPYSDDPGNNGRMLLTSKYIVSIARELIPRGYRVAVHAIGDAALDNVIDAFKIVAPGLMGRIEHASIAWDEQIDALASLGIYTVVQPRFRESDWWIEKRLGGRYRLAYRLKTMINRGVKLALSTDAPVEPVDPWETVRTALGLCNAPACIEMENLNDKEIIKAYTEIAAKASGGIVAGLGRIEKSAPAVFTIADRWPPRREMSGKIVFKPLVMH